MTEEAKKNTNWTISNVKFNNLEYTVTVSVSFHVLVHGSDDNDGFVVQPILNSNPRLIIGAWEVALSY